MPLRFSSRRLVVSFLVDDLAEYGCHVRDGFSGSSFRGDDGVAVTEYVRYCACLYDGRFICFQQDFESARDCWVYVERRERLGRVVEVRMC